MKTTSTKLSFVLFFLLSCPFIIYCQTEGLIAYYAFNGSAIDSTEYEHHGAVINATLAPDLLGVEDRAYHFNGVDSYITAGNASTLQIDTAVTISVWFNAKGAGSQNAGGILVNKEGEYSFARFADGSIRYAFAFNDFWDNHINTNVTVPLNENTHAVLTYSQAAGEIKLYVNCQLVYIENENAIIGDVAPDMNEMRIGGRMFLNQFFDGTIDEVKIFNRALTLDEIAENCILTSTKDINTPQLTFNVFPNPTAGNIQITGDFSKVAKVKVFNISGQLIKEQDTNFENISLSGMTAGIYFIAIFDSENQLLETKRVIKIGEKA
jgi:concanavalin A-like lectin/glucanase superfamily protein/type IX secretion system substrate protein